MSDTPNYITPQGLEKLRAEYQQLFHNERPKLVETIAWAAGNGDRSENGDYIYGKRRLRQIDSRLNFLGRRIESAQVVDPTTINSEQIRFGATVTIANEDGEQKTIKIVGEDEIDPESNHISWRSPMARSLLGKLQGDEVLVKRPGGDAYVEVIEVTYK